MSAPKSRTLGVRWPNGSGHQPIQSDVCGADMGTTHFYSIQLSLRKFWFDSWLTMALQDLIQISSQLKMDFWNLIQIDSWLEQKSVSFCRLMIRLWVMPMSGVGYGFESHRRSVTRPSLPPGIDDLWTVLWCIWIDDLFSFTVYLHIIIGKRKTLRNEMFQWTKATVTIFLDDLFIFYLYSYSRPHS